MASSLRHKACANRRLPGLIAVVWLASGGAAVAQQAQPAATFGPEGAKAVPSQSTAPMPGRNDIVPMLQSPIPNPVSVPFQGAIKIEPDVPAYPNADRNEMMPPVRLPARQFSLEPKPPLGFGTDPPSVSAFGAPGNAGNGGAGGMAAAANRIDIAADHATAFGGASGPAGAGYSPVTPSFLAYGSDDGWRVRIVTPLTANASDAALAPPSGVQARRVINLSDTLSGNLVAGAYYDASRLAPGPAVKLRARFEIGF